MRCPDTAYITFQDGHTAWITFDGKCGDSFLREIKKTPWLNWKRLPVEPGSDKNKFYLVADLTCANEHERRCDLANILIEQGLFLECRTKNETNYSDEYKKYFFYYEDFGTFKDLEEEVER